MGKAIGEAAALKAAARTTPMVSGTPDRVAGWADSRLGHFHFPAHLLRFFL